MVLSAIGERPVGAATAVANRAIAGNPKKLAAPEELAKERATCRQITAALSHGFTTRWTLYCSADLMVAKPAIDDFGSLARGLPMALIEPIPGRKNATLGHLPGSGAAIRCHNLPARRGKLPRVDDSQGWQECEAARDLGRPAPPRPSPKSALRCRLKDSVKEAGGKRLAARSPRIAQFDATPYTAD